MSRRSADCAEVAGASLDRALSRVDLDEDVVDSGGCGWGRSFVGGSSSSGQALGHGPRDDRMRSKWAGDVRAVVLSRAVEGDSSGRVQWNRRGCWRGLLGRTARKIIE